MAATCRTPESGRAAEGLPLARLGSRDWTRYAANQLVLIDAKEESRNAGRIFLCRTPGRDRTQSGQGTGALRPGGARNQGRIASCVPARDLAQRQNRPDEDVGPRYSRRRRKARNR